MNNSKSTDGQPNVLVVDDEQPTAELFADFLAEEYNVETAYSGQEALDVANADVDVVLLDRKMPGISGDEVLQTIRGRNIDCRVVMVTAIEPELTVLDLPFDDYLVKPASREMIRKVVSAMLVRNRYDEKVGEVVALCSKMATIESKLTIAELEASSKYAAIESRFDDLRAEADMGGPSDDLYAEFTVEKIRALMG